MLEIQNVSKSFSVGLNIFKKRPQIKVLENLSFSVEENQSLAIIGKNGSGKTTLLKVITGLITPDNGEVLFNGSNKKNNTAIINTNDRSFFWRLTVEENLKFFCSFDELSKENYDQVIRLCGLEDKLGNLYASLSYGQKKKLSVARALLKNCDILLMDEITSSLDITAKRDILRFIKQLKEQRILKGIVFSTHNLREVFELADFYIFIDNGKISKHGLVSEISSLRELEDIFYEK